MGRGGWNSPLSNGCALRWAGCCLVASWPRTGSLGSRAAQASTQTWHLRLPTLGQVVLRHGTEQGSGVRAPVSGEKVSPAEVQHRRRCDNNSRCLYSFRKFLLCRPLLVFTHHTCTARARCIRSGCICVRICPLPSTGKAGRSQKSAESSRDNSHATQRERRWW